MNARSTLIVGLVAGVMAAAAVAVAKPVKVMSDDAILDTPSSPKASLVLLPGDAGLSDTDPLQRAKAKFVEKGLAVLSIDQKTVVRAAMRTAAETATPVSIAAVSSGVRRLAGAIASPGFRTRKVILVSGNLDAAREIIGKADLLPPTLVIHHRKDGCAMTPPAQVQAFQEWGGNRVTVHWMEGGSDSGDACGPQSHHGMAGLDDQLVDAIARFLDQ